MVPLGIAPNVGAAMAAMSSVNVVANAVLPKRWSTIKSGDTEWRVNEETPCGYGIVFCMTELNSHQGNTHLPRFVQLWRDLLGYGQRHNASAPLIAKKLSVR